jgi:hypothetical protein
MNIRGDNRQSVFVLPEEHLGVIGATQLPQNSVLENALFLNSQLLCLKI